MYIGNDCTLENGLKISVDWIGFTVKKFTSFLSVMEYFGLSFDDFSKSARGMYGYRSCLRHPVYKLLVLFDGNDDMGIHIEVPGSGIPYFLDCYFKKHSNVSPFGGLAFNVESFDDTFLSYLLKDILDIGQLTRMDLAIDDIGCNYYSITELQDLLLKGCYVSRFRKYKCITECGKGGISGNTIYFGSRTSALMLRVYDKQLEQNAKKEVIRYPWVRWELELHNARAVASAVFIVAGKTLSDVAIGILSNYLRFINKDSSRDSRCTTSEKWQNFLNGVEKIRLCQSVIEKSLDDKREWVMRQVAPTLSAIYAIDGDLGFIYSCIEQGNFRLSVELRELISSALSSYT